MTLRRWLLPLLAASVVGCPSPKPGEPDGSIPVDSGIPDASVDAGPPDAGDGGVPDASVPDSGLSDAGDGGGLTDGGDGGRFDGGLLDAGDGGAYDAGDSGPAPVIFSAQIIDFCNNYTPLEGVQVALLGGGASALTDSQGNYQLPVQAGVPFTQVLQLTGYQTSYAAEVSIQSDLTLSVTQIPLVCTAVYQSLTSSLSNLNANDGIILAKIESLATSGSCTDQSGWAFQIAPSGGETYIYFDVTNSPNPALTTTQSFGIAAVYNIAASRVLLSAVKPDAGCANADSVVGLTGYLELAPGILSLGGYFIQ